MPCRIANLPGGGYAIVCSRGERPKPCCICGRVGGKLCDYPLRGEKEGKTCYRPLCSKCTVHSAPHDIDLCPSHAALAKKEDGKR